MSSINDSDIIGESISTNILNKSHSKQMYSFSKASRFQLIKAPLSSVFYKDDLHGCDIAIHRA
jgi:hypothetical protein